MFCYFSYGKLIVTESLFIFFQRFLFAPRITVQFLILISFAAEDLAPIYFPDIPFHYSPLLCYCHPCLFCGPGIYQPLFFPRAFALALFSSWNVFLPQVLYGCFWLFRSSLPVQSHSHPPTQTEAQFHHHLTYFIPSYLFHHICDLKFVWINHFFPH